MEKIGDHPVIARLLREGYPEPPVCRVCDVCGGEIYLDDWYYRIEGRIYCQDCIEDCRELAD